MKVGLPFVVFGAVVCILLTVVITYNASNGLLRHEVQQLSDSVDDNSEVIDQKETEIVYIQEQFAQKSLDLTDLQQQLDVCNSQNLVLQADADQQQEFLDKAYDDLETQRQRYVGLIDDIEDDKDKVEGDLSSCKIEKEEYTATFLSSVRAVCCSFADVQNGAQREWNYVGTQIICTEDGEYEVECGTGRTDYDP